MSIEPVRLTHKSQITVGEPETSGHVRYEPVHIADVPALSSGVVTFTWPYPVDILSGHILSVTDGLGEMAVTSHDEFSSYSSVIIGQTTTAHVVGDTTVNIAKGAPVEFDQGDAVKLNGNISEVDEDEGTYLTLYTALTEDIAAGTYVDFRRYFVGRPGSPLIMGQHVLDLEFGGDTSDSSRIPVGVSLNIEYKNTHATEVRDVHGYLALLY